MIILECGICQIVTSQEYVPFIDHGYLHVGSDMWRIKTHIDTFSHQPLSCFSVAFIGQGISCSGAFFKNNLNPDTTFGRLDKPGEDPV